LVELWEEIESNEDYASRIVGRLSYVLTDGGAQLTQNQQQRLNIARALVRQPAVLICDNFTSSLDMVMKERILKAVEGFLKKV
jgi:ABC-type multidrug transport system fused ATPase/permease subunit